VLLRQQVELAEHETRALANKIRRMETILAAEQGARVETEVRCEQLLRQNKELISLLSKMITDNNNGDPFTELALESLNAAKKIADANDRVSVGNVSLVLTFQILKCFLAHVSRNTYSYELNCRWKQNSSRNVFLPRNSDRSFAQYNEYI